jgi:hypothetical protein
MARDAAIEYLEGLRKRLAARELEGDTFDIEVTAIVGDEAE